MSTTVYILAGLLLSLNAGFVLGVVFHRVAVDHEERVKQHVTAEVTAMRRVLIAEMDSLKRELMGDAEHVRQGMKDVIRNI